MVRRSTGAVRQRSWPDTRNAREHDAQIGIGTARLNGLDHEAYLAYVLERIADHPANRVDELLPWRVADRLGVPR